MQLQQKNLLARNLKKYVRKSGKNPRKICKDLNIPYSKYQEWISEDSVVMPHAETLASLANYLGIRTADFFLDDSTTSPLDKTNKELLKSIEKMEKEAMRTKKPKQRKYGWISILLLLIIIAVIVYLYLHKGG